MKIYLFLLFILCFSGYTRDYPVPLGPDYPPSPIPFHPRPEPTPTILPPCNCDSEIAELQLKIQMLEAEIEKLRATIIKTRNDENKNDKSPCAPKTLKRIENAFFNYNYDHKANLFPDGTMPPFTTLTDEGYLKEIPAFFRLVRLNDKQEAYCKKIRTNDNGE